MGQGVTIEDLMRLLVLSLDPRQSAYGPIYAHSSLLLSANDVGTLASPFGHLLVAQGWS